jgi:hypothetical protein
VYWFQSRVRFNQVVCTRRTHDQHHQLHEQASSTSAQPPGSKVNDPIGIEHKGHTPSSLEYSSEEVPSGLPSPMGESNFYLELAHYTPWAIQAFTRLATLPYPPFNVMSPPSAEPAPPRTSTVPHMPVVVVGSSCVARLVPRSTFTTSPLRIKHAFADISTPMRTSILPPVFKPVPPTCATIPQHQWHLHCYSSSWRSCRRPPRTSTYVPGLT